jgi:hypothetical protein
MVGYETHSTEFNGQVCAIATAIVSPNIKKMLGSTLPIVNIMYVNVSISMHLKYIYTVLLLTTVPPFKMYI